MGDVTVEFSPSVGALFAALAKARSQFKPWKKDKTNPHLGSKYGDLASLMEACQEGLTANGLVVVQLLSGDDPRLIRITTTLGHSSGEWVRSTFAVSVEQQKGLNANQSMVSAVTYGKRAAYGAAVGVASEGEDDDGHASGGQTEKRSRPAPEKPPASAAPQGNASAPATFPNYGKAKGMPIKGASAADLDFYAKGARDNLARPEKERWHGQARALLEAIEAEVARQKGEAPAETVASVYEQAMALIKGAEAPLKVEEVLKRARGKTTAEEYAALEAVGRQRKEALGRVDAEDLDARAESVDDAPF